MDKVTHNTPLLSNQNKLALHKVKVYYEHIVHV